MGHKEAPETVQWQEKNWKNFLSWTKAHGRMVMPIPGKAVIYAGFPASDLVKVKKFLMSESDLIGVWKEIEKVNKNIVEWSGRTEYDKLSDVIKRIRSPLPKVHYTHGNLIGREKTNFQNLDHCVKNLTSRADRFLDRGKHKAVWQKLSKLYVENASGEITIWEGRKKNYKQVDAGRQFINTEIKALLKKKTLPPETLKKVVEIAQRHERYYKTQEDDFEKLIAAARKKIAAAAKS